MAAEPARNLATASLGDISLLLLRHFQPQLIERGFPLPSANLPALATALAAGQRPDKADAIAHELTPLVEASLALLGTRWGLSFAQSLRADAGDVAAWRTTADLLALANDKAEAETCIALGAALLSVLGRRDYARCLVAVIERDAGAGDADARIAGRVLRHISGIDHTSAGWQRRVRLWLDSAL